MRLFRLLRYRMLRYRRPHRSRSALATVPEGAPTLEAAVRQALQRSHGSVEQVQIREMGPWHGGVLLVVSGSFQQHGRQAPLVGYALGMRRTQGWHIRTLHYSVTDRRIEI